MKSYSSSEVIEMLKADGWYHVRTKGDHWHFKHPIKKRYCDGSTPEKRFNDKRFKKYRKTIGIKI